MFAGTGPSEGHKRLWLPQAMQDRRDRMVCLCHTCRKHEVQRDRYALAAAGMELGMLCIETGERDEAKRVLEHTKLATAALILINWSHELWGCFLFFFDKKDAQ